MNPDRTETNSIIDHCVTILNAFINTLESSILKITTLLKIVFFLPCKVDEEKKTLDDDEEGKKSVCFINNDVVSTNPVSS